MHACNARIWRPDLKNKVEAIPTFPILNRIFQADMGMLKPWMLLTPS